LHAAKRYHVHRSIERQRSHVDRVKRLQGTRCGACDLEMAEVYGELALGMIDVHHLTPLSQLADGATVTFDPRSDFAVLCPNCHRAAHRLGDPGDIQALRLLVQNGLLGRMPRSER